MRESILDVFEKGVDANEPVRICAPMVRYSKLAFRNLVRTYNCDIAYTPMIIANSFVASTKARDNEFTTCEGDHPLVVQFASSNAEDFAAASEIVSPFCEGVDLNCGCPQKWAIKSGFGACLIHNPVLLKDVVKQTWNRIPNNRFSVSVKIRLHKNLKDTVELCRQLEKAHVSYVTVHCRTQDQRSRDLPDRSVLRDVTQSVQIPIVANGDITCMTDVNRIHEETGVTGVMSARGLLKNPAFFAGYETTPLECVSKWMDEATATGTSLSCFQHHLAYMCEETLPRAERKYINMLGSFASIRDYFETNYGI